MAANSNIIRWNDNTTSLQPESLHILNKFCNIKTKCYRDRNMKRKQPFSPKACTRPASKEFFKNPHPGTDVFHLPVIIPNDNPLYNITVASQIITEYLFIVKHRNNRSLSRKTCSCGNSERKRNIFRCDVVDSRFPLPV